MTLEWKTNSLVYNMSRKIANRNLWKVEKLCFDIEDLLQECYIVFHKCKEEYGNLEDNEFIGVFKSSLNNRIFDLNKEARQCCIDSTFLEEEDSLNVETIVDFKMRLENMPQDIKRYAKIFIDRKATSLNWKDREKAKIKIKRYLFS